MKEPFSAEDDLPLIQSLMERSTVYRAISAQSALLAGLLSSLAAGAVYYNNEINLVIGRTVGPREFATFWIVVLVLVVLTTVFLLRREAKNSSRPFMSSGMKVALRAIVPNLLIPAAFTLWFFGTGYLGAQELELVVVWVAFYGLALLSTAFFAPRSLAILGWAFLLTSLSVPVLMDVIDNLTDDVPDTVMGVTFGLYHLIYAVATWPRKGRDRAAPTAHQ